MTERLKAGLALAGAIGLVLSLLILFCAFQAVGTERPWPGDYQGTLITVATLVLIAFLAAVISSD